MFCVEQLEQDTDNSCGFNEAAALPGRARGGVLWSGSGTGTGGARRATEVPAPPSAGLGDSSWGALAVLVACGGAVLIAGLDVLVVGGELAGAEVEAAEKEGDEVDAEGELCVLAAGARKVGEAFDSSVVLETFIGPETEGLVPVGGAVFFFPPSNGLIPFMIPPFFFLADGGLPLSVGCSASSEVSSSSAVFRLTLMGPEICSLPFSDPVELAAGLMAEGAPDEALRGWLGVEIVPEMERGGGRWGTGVGLGSAEVLWLTTGVGVAGVGDTTAGAAGSSDDSPASSGESMGVSQE